MEQSLRVFHQAIRNNGLWTHWIEASASFPKYEAMLLEELAAVIENLSPKYLKDIKVIIPVLMATRCSLHPTIIFFIFFFCVKFIFFFRSLDSV